jgi:GNAT superfamily N-acetyltransferase
MGSSHPGKIEIRPIRPEEHYFLREMLEEAAYFPDPSLREQKLKEIEPTLSSYFENFGTKGDVALVAESSEGDLLGAVWTRLFDRQLRGHGFVDEETPELGIALTEPYRNRGIGSLLIERISDELVKLGFKRVCLGVDGRNPAVALYTRIGFRVHSRGVNAVVMVKDLT